MIRVVVSGRRDVSAMYTKKRRSYGYTVVGRRGDSLVKTPSPQSKSQLDHEEATNRLTSHDDVTGYSQIL